MKLIKKFIHLFELRKEKLFKNKKSLFSLWFVLDGVLEIASYIFCILVMDRIGRRILLTFLLLLAGVGLVISVVVNIYAGDNEGLFNLL